jgi:hypothetical protein
MRKTQIGTCIAAFALLAALPATAAASPQLLEAGKPVAPTSKMLATSSGNATFTGTNSKGEDDGTVTCTKAQMTGEVISNKGTLIEVQIETASFTGTEAEGKCASTIPGTGPLKVIAENLPWCVTSAVLESFSFRGGSCAVGASNVKATLVGSFGLTCTYERATVAGTYVKEVNPAKLSVVSQTFNLIKGGAACPAQGHMSVAYVLENDTNFVALSIA